MLRQLFALPDLTHLVTIALLPDSASPKNINLTIFPRPFAVGLFSANLCALEFILLGGGVEGKEPAH